MVHKSYGIIAYKKNASGELEFLLVKNKSGDHWGFPKGTPEAGETEEETARREFGEETGIKAPIYLNGGGNASIDQKAFFIEEYDFEHQGEKKHKINKYFVGEINKEEKAGEVFADIEEFAWKDFEGALATLTFERSREILREVNEIIAL